MTPAGLLGKPGRLRAGVLVVAAGALVSGSAIGGAGWAWALISAVVLALARASRSGPAFRAAMVATTVVAVYAGGVLLGLGPAPVTIAAGLFPLAALVWLGRNGRWRPAMPWLRIGRPDPVSWVLGVATVTATAIALLLFTLLGDPDASAYLSALRSVPTWVAVLGILAFALVNAVWEEVVFRGALQHELAQTLGAWPAVVIQAVLFGLAHLHGFPSGWIGVLMAAGWGSVLGVIRLRTGAIALPYLVHVCADLTIGICVLVLLR